MTSITRPETADAAAISAMAEDAFCETFGHMYPPEDLAGFLATWNPPEKVAAQIADPDFALSMARDAAGAVLGYIKIGPLDFELPPEELVGDPVIELHHLYMRASAKGTGAAAKLMDWAMDEARSRGAKRIYLTVFVENLRAQAFYRRYGFTEIGKNPFRVGNTVDDDRIWRAML